MPLRLPRLADWKRPFRGMINSRVNVRLKELTGLTPRNQFHPDDVFIVSYPKSGSTWFQNLVAGAVFGIDPAYAPDTLIHTIVPDVHGERYFKRCATPTYFKSHWLPRSDCRNVIYLLRDGRDAMVSYYHHLCAHARKTLDFLHIVKSSQGLFPCRWHEHVQAWKSNPHGARVLWLRYEDLLSDPMRELKRFCEFCSLDRPHQLLQRAIDGSSFNQMREREIKFGWDNTEWPTDKFFVRRGQAGSYRDEMPEEVLRAFMAQAGQTLAELGYR